jgi:hypothetical protein
MDIKNKRILEALKMQPLSQEEMTARHILGRLYGPIATCVESTRNGRLYNKPLWEKALEDDIFLEKVATKALFLELGHPADREETDMKQACACIPEVPKIVGDDLYAYVDILDTPNGRLLKTLVDYGFVPGISSRGSGDVMDNNQVDPETFFLETWDIVQLPAVKKARLNVCESLDSDSIKLKRALAESYKAAKEEDKDTMKKALENLNININEELTESTNLKMEVVKTDKGFEVKDSFGFRSRTFETEDEAKAFIADVEDECKNGPKKRFSEEFVPEDIPWDTEEEEELLLEETDEEETSEEEVETDTEEASEEIEEVSEENGEVADEEETEEASEDNKEAVEDGSVDVAGEGDSAVDTVGDAIQLLQEFDEDTKVEFEITQADGEEVPADRIEHFFDDETLVLNVKSCDESETEDAEETVETEDDADSNIETETEDEEASAETIEEIDDEEETDSAENNGDVEVIESLKEMVRQKEAMETELGQLRKAKTVGDAKEQELQEQLAKYRKLFKALKERAALVPELQSSVTELNEQLAQANQTIETLTEQVNNARQLKESVDASKAKVSKLTEQLSAATKNSKTLEAKLEGQTKVYTQKLEERTKLAKSYKARFIETLNKYVDSKADMLGVQPSEITSRLNENYTLADVDAVCDQILDSAVNFSRLPFSGRTKTSARMTESVNRTSKSKIDPAYGYEIDDDLLELAGLKK